jgi:hypothetical protein
MSLKTARVLRTSDSRSCAASRRFRSQTPLWSPTTRTFSMQLANSRMLQQCSSPFWTGLTNVTRGPRFRRCMCRLLPWKTGGLACNVLNKTHVSSLALYRQSFTNDNVDSDHLGWGYRLHERRRVGCRPACSGTLSPGSKATS